MNRSCNQEGLSLLETMASIVIFFIVAAGLTATTLQVIKTNLFSRDATSAASLIQDKLEEFRAMPPDTLRQMLPITEDDFSGSDGPWTADGIAQASGRFARSWLITRGPSNMYRITVSVSWSDPQPRTLSETAYYCWSATCP